jgi:uncharacterized protein
MTEHRHGGIDTVYAERINTLESVASRRSPKNDRDLFALAGAAGVVAGFMLLLLVNRGWRPVAKNFVYGTVESFTLPLLVTPVAIFLWWKKPKGREGMVRLLRLAIGLNWISSVALNTPSLTVTKGLQWNWSGKLLSIAAMLTFVLSWRGATPAQIGLTTRLERGRWWPWLALLSVTVVVAVRGAFNGDPEEFLYQLTMPGLDEELSFRGVMLVLLLMAFGHVQRRYGQVSFGWAFAIVAALFVLVHILSITPHGLEWSNVVATPSFLTYATIFAITRLWTGSIWPAVIVHNAGNVFLTANDLFGGVFELTALVVVVLMLRRTHRNEKLNRGQESTISAT